MQFLLHCRTSDLTLLNLLPPFQLPTPKIILWPFIYHCESMPTSSEMKDCYRTGMDSCNNAYMTGRTSDLQMEEVLSILRRENLDETKIIVLPPVLPKGGEVFVYCSSSPVPEHEHDYRFDQYR